MTKIKGKWITQEETEVRILRRLLNEGPLNMPALENKNRSDRLSHTSVIKTIDKLLKEKKISITDTDTTIPKRPIKTFEIKILGIMKYFDWIFPSFDIKYREEIWEGIKESKKKISKQDIIKYFPHIGKHWKKLDSLLGGAIFWWFGVAYGQTNLSLVLPPLKNKTPTDISIPDSYDFSFKIQITGFNSNFSYELKISKLFLVHTTESIRELEKYDNESELSLDNFNQIQKLVTNTITFLFFYDILADYLQKQVIFKINPNSPILTESKKTIDSILSIIKNDEHLKILFVEYLGIIKAKIKDDETIIFLLQSMS